MGCVGTMDDVVFKDGQSKAVIPIDDNSQSKTKTMKVCTANLQKFSPFEYVLTDKKPHIRQHVQSTCFDEDKLDLYFTQTCQRYPSRLITKQKKYRQLLQILHNQTIKRYCPLTNQEVGILSEQKTQILHEFIEIGTSKQKNESKLRNRKIRLMNTREFCEKWDEQFKNIKDEQGYKNIRKKIYTQFSSSQIIRQMIKDLKQFDLICYHSLLLFNQQINQATTEQPQQQQQQSQIFPLPLVNILLKAPLIDKQITNMECCEDIQRIIRKGEFMKYIWMMKQLFSKVCLNQQNRVQKLVSWLEKRDLDVVFLQHVSSENVELLKVLLKGHRIVHSDNNAAAILVKESLVRAFQLDYANLTLTGHNARYLSSSDMETNSKSWLTKQLNKTTNSLFKKTSNKNEDTNLIRDLKYMLQNDSQDGQQHQRNKTIQMNYRQQTSLFNYQSNVTSAHQGIEFEEEAEGGDQLQTELQKQYKDILEDLTSQIVDKVQIILQQHSKPQTRKQQQKATHSPSPKQQKQRKRHHPQHNPHQHQESKSKSSLLQQYNNNPNIILMSKQKFLQQQHIFNQTIFNNNLIQFIGSLILISAHVKSQQNGSVNQMREKLIELRRAFPYHTIIVGVYIQPKLNKSKYKIVDTMKKFRKVQSKQLEDSEEQMMNKFHFAPDIYDAVPGIFFQDKCAIDTKKLKNLVEKNGYYTSSKKKTCFQITQEQRNSSQMGADNFIVTTKQISNYQIVSCEESISNNKDYCKQEHIIPNQKHPFGNYFVVASVQAQVKQVVIDTEVLYQ